MIDTAYPSPTIAEVRVIINDTTEPYLVTDDQVQAAIDAANCIVQDMYVNCSCGNGLTDACLTIVATWLAAAFCAIMYPYLNLASKTDECADSSVKFNVSTGKGVLGTTFGQAANTISQGCLAEYDKTPAFMAIIGDICGCFEGVSYG